MFSVHYLVSVCVFHLCNFYVFILCAPHILRRELPVLRLFNN